MNLNQITVPALDVAASIEFYKKLGLKLIVKALPHYARFECPEGEATFSLHKVEEKDETAGFMTYFETKNLDEKVETLVAQGVIFDEMPEDRSWLWREARLKDPYGNRIIIFYAGKNRKNPPWRIEE